MGGGLKLRLLRTPVFAAAAALTLALGIGSVAAAFAIVHGVLLDPLPYGNPDRLVSQELDALKGRVRHLIADGHWPTDGEWKESVLRTVLRRHLPPTLGVGRGFVVGPRTPSSQIDV